MTKSPCYKCESRFLGCHSNCDNYLNWKKEIQIHKDNNKCLRVTGNYDYLTHRIKEDNRYKRRYNF